MAIKKSISSSDGIVFDYASVIRYEFSSEIECIATIGLYKDRLSAERIISPDRHVLVRCDGVEPGQNTMAQIYGVLASMPEYAGAEPISYDAMVGFSAPRYPIPIRPSPSHEWDGLQWFIPQSAIDMAKTARKKHINSERNRAEASGFEAYGKVFDSDSTSLQRISVVAMAAQLAPDDFTIDWTCADNSVVTLTKWQLVSLPSIMAQAGGQLHAKARLLKSQIDVAETIDEVNSVCW